MIVVGSGFGGAVSALRLAEQGLGVLVLEQGLLTRPRRAPVPLPPPIKLKSGPVTTEWILAAIAEGRE